MEALLSSLLAENGVHADVITYMSGQGCVTLKKFANWVDNKNEFKTAVMDNVTDHVDDRASFAGLKQAFREASAIVDRMVKRTAEGLSEFADDEPLPIGVQEALEDSFLKMYKITLPSSRYPCDLLIGRCKREFDRRGVTMFSVTKVRSRAIAQRSEKRRRTVGQGLALEIEDDLGPQESSGTFRDRLDQYELLMYAWVIAGSFEVPGDGARVPFCSLQQGLSYLWELQDKTATLIKKYPDAVVERYLITCEEAIRNMAIDKSRDRTSPVTWGVALAQAASECKGVWQDNKDMLVRQLGSSSLAQGGRASGNTGAPPWGQARKSSNEQVVQGSAPKSHNTAKVGTCTHNSNNQPLCKKYNDSRGCKSSCPDGKVHGCDVRLAKSGQACGSKSHTRKTHDAQKHGESARETR